MRVAIVHDWLIAGGAEKVVYEIHRMYPDAPIYTSYCTDEWRQRMDGKVITGFLQRWPFPRLRKFVPFLRAWWFSRLDLSGYDLVISSSGAEAKGIRVPKGTVHINYCHAPTHYYWSRYDEYMKNPGFGLFDPLARAGLKLLVGPMRRWDYKAAQRPDHIICNSTHIKSEIKKYYGRDATVISPPIDISRFKLGAKKRHGFLAVGRQTPYKRIDLAVAAATELSAPLTVVGDGPDFGKLKKMAGPSVTFLGFVDGPKVIEAYQSAEAFLFPGLDDFGIAPVEAMACGTPVIAYKAGGALDYVVPGKTGEFFAEQTVQSLAVAMKNFNPSKYSHSDIKRYAEGFSSAKFQKSLSSYIKKVIQ